MNPRSVFFFNLRTYSEYMNTYMNKISSVFRHLSRAWNRRGSAGHRMARVTFQHHPMAIQPWENAGHSKPTKMEMDWNVSLYNICIYIYMIMHIVWGTNKDMDQANGNPSTWTYMKHIEYNQVTYGMSPVLSIRSVVVALGAITWIPCTIFIGFCRMWKHGFFSNEPTKIYGGLIYKKTILGIGESCGPGMLPFLVTSAVAEFANISDLPTYRASCPPLPGSPECFVTMTWNLQHRGVMKQDITKRGPSPLGPNNSQLKFA